ncbi:MULTISPECIES: DUF3817 domain-containing protein [Rossellomorea]|jgi:integral membrane protein|uniref:DUF3817 domain-containing protein n=1 Tax=Rossellomorea marisflavi TaxID=189381 RepID=A0A0J5Y3L6_9BACI|nr:DUF3817 domain-containing protein [Rossellomorea marisflavi]KQU58305.1 hypothetical protein ASG66_14805 [Bacillus sp. Leaf406]MBV6685794.1 DUF3817 domain-containing protein [Bacillus sp. JRC01]VXC43054.1 conserved membrane hypothetical protein [Bacillus sp. 349Y]KMK93145.1 membrane protein [Rossellomorea marisflavi]KML07820.1 membrane protein [Rossellomorea marisflavi]
MQHTTSIGRLRQAGFVEGMSLLILLLIAMPLKYMADIPMAVTIVGSLHGGLFVIYLLILAYVTFKVRWHLKWSVAGVLVAFIPFGNFIYDRVLRKFETRA